MLLLAIDQAHQSTLNRPHAKMCKKKGYHECASTLSTPHNIGQYCEEPFCPHNTSAVADMWPPAMDQAADQHALFEKLLARVL